MVYRAAFDELDTLESSALQAQDWHALAACGEVRKQRWPEGMHGWRLIAIAEQSMALEQATARFGPGESGWPAMNELIARFPRTQAQLSADGWSAFSERQLPLAILLWHIGVERFPLQPEMPHGLAVALQAGGHVREAQDVLTDALVRFPGSRVLRVDLAWNALQRHDWDAAVDLWTELQHDMPESLAVWHGGSLALLRGGNPNMAEALLEHGMDLFPDDPFLGREHAAMAAGQGRWSEAARRWDALRARFPEDRDSYLHGAECLQKAGQALQADRVLQAAAAHWPTHEGAAVAQIRSAITCQDAAAAQARCEVAMGQFAGSAEVQALAIEVALRGGELALAEARATDGVRRFPDDPRIRWGAAAVATQRSGASPEQTLAGAHSEPDPASTELMLAFESLGGNCEIGIVQRHFGAEPLGLWRFAGVSPTQVTAALDDDLRDIGDPAFTYLAASPDGEYLVRDRRYFLNSHTFHYAAAADPDRLLAGQCRKLRFLADKFRDDLRELPKIFVYRAPLPVPDAILLGLHRALLRHGPAQLLCVRTVFGDEWEPAAGSVHRLREGLLLGHVGRLGQLEDGTANSDFSVWLKIFRQAHTSFRGTPAPAARS